MENDRAIEQNVSIESGVEKSVAVKKEAEIRRDLLKLLQVDDDTLLEAPTLLDLPVNVVLEPTEDTPSRREMLVRMLQGEIKKEEDLVQRLTTLEATMLEEEDTLVSCGSEDIQPCGNEVTQTGILTTNELHSLETQIQGLVQEDAQSEAQADDLWKQVFLKEKQVGDLQEDAQGLRLETVERTQVCSRYAFLLGYGTMISVVLHRD